MLTFPELREMERERFRLFGPRNQEQSFPDSIFRPFTPAQTGFMFSTQPAARKTAA